MRPRPDAATDGDRWGAYDRGDGGPDQTQLQPIRAVLRRHDMRIYPQAAGAASQQLAIDHEAGPLRDLVVEPHRGVVGLMGLPVDARTSGVRGLFVDAVDQ